MKYTVITAVATLSSAPGTCSSLDGGVLMSVPRSTPLDTFIFHDMYSILCPWTVNSSSRTSQSEIELVRLFWRQFHRRRRLRRFLRHLGTTTMAAYENTHERARMLPPARCPLPCPAAQQPCCLFTSCCLTHGAYGRTMGPGQAAAAASRAPFGANDLSPRFAGAAATSKVILG